MAGVLCCRFPRLPLIPGCYYINVGLYPTNWDYAYDYHWQMHPLLVLNGAGVQSQVSGVVALEPELSVRLPRKSTEEKKQ